MDQIFTILSDLVVIIFDLIIYIMLFVPNKNNKKYKGIMYLGCTVILLAYSILTYIYKWPASITAAVFMAIPSFILFFILSKYKDARFVLTFCFIDTVSLIIAFIGRYAGILSHLGSVISFFIILLLVIFIIIYCKKYIMEYHDLIAITQHGWRYMAITSAVIYFYMIFLAAYPKPMVERIEYAPIWLIFAIIVILCYTVFIQSIIKTKRITEQTSKLEQEKHYHALAFTDSLTGLKNRASYVERINQLQRQQNTTICCFMIDNNNLKQINDKYGHHVGDTVLTQTAEILKKVFLPRGGEIFRIGGDEFTVILYSQQIEDILTEFDLLLQSESEKLGIKISAAIGYAFANQDISIENAFIQADENMYKNKKILKGIE